MKRIYLVFGVILLLLAGNSHAESPTDKGVYNLSGSVSYSHTKDSTSGDTTKTISLRPAGSYFVYPNLSIGSMIIYSDFKASGSESKYYGVGPVVRYYFGEEKGIPFLSLEYIYTRSKGNMSYLGFTSNSTGRGNDISLGIGVDYFLSKNVALEPIARYIFSHSDSHSVTLGSPSGTNNRWEELLIGVGINVFIY